MKTLGLVILALSMIVAAPSRLEAASAIARKNAADATEFFSKLKENKSVVRLSSGLFYEILAPGTGLTPRPTDRVRVNYEGRLLDGTVFDSSYKRGQPVDLTL